MTSNELLTTQKTLENLAKEEIDNAMTNHVKLNRLLKVIKEVDEIRREVWNREKFGKYEEIANDTLDFCSDDIPF